MAIKQYIKVIGILLLFSTYILMTWTFIIAYGTESKSMVVQIDEEGEADLEMFVLIPFTGIMGLFSVIYTIKDERRIKNEL